jgi:hypothetical protein
VRAAGNALNADWSAAMVVVRQEEVRVRAVEHHDRYPVVLLDLGEQIMQSDDHHRVDEVDRWVVEGHAP